MIDKAYGFVLREGAAGTELLAFEHAGQPEAGLEVPGGAIEAGETPLAAVTREVLEESGLPLEGWEAVATLEHQAVPGSGTPGPQRWHCFAMTPSALLPDSWRWEPVGSTSERGLRFEYRWIALAGGEPWTRGPRSARSGRQSATSEGSRTVSRRPAGDPGGGVGAPPPQKEHPRTDGWAEQPCEVSLASTTRPCAVSSGMGVWGAAPPTDEERDRVREGPPLEAALRPRGFRGHAGVSPSPQPSAQGEGAGKGRSALGLRPGRRSPHPNTSKAAGSGRSEGRLTAALTDGLRNG